MEAIKQAVISSNVINFDTNPHEGDLLDFIEGFALATVGGAQVLGLETEVGNFKVGKYFDALVISPSSFHTFEHDTLQDIFQKFIFCGSNHDIKQVYVAGKKVLDHK